MRTSLVALAIAALGLPGAARAQLVPTGINCAAFGAVNVLEAFNPDATACAGAFAGNDKSFATEIEALIAANSWGSMSYLGSSDEGVSPFSNGPTGATGTLMFDSPLTGPFVLSLKSSQAFSLYYFADLVDVSEIYYSMLGTAVNQNDQTQGLSHASLWGGAVSVPEPGAAVLMLTGLVGLAVVRRRRERDAA